MSGLDPEILILAGTNGAGKSSVAGVVLRLRGGDYFNPDEEARGCRAHDLELSVVQANACAWAIGVRMLRAAIDRRLRFAFETTLGGRTITGLLRKATNVGIPVRVWYVGLETADLHVERVLARVERGGHAIPEERIRHRYDASRTNLIALLPHLAELKLYDNTRGGDPSRGGVPEPLLVLHLKNGKLIDGCRLIDVPGWARPILQAAAIMYGGGGS